MQLTKELLRNAFLEGLKQNNLKVYFEKNNFYILTKGDDSSRIVAAQLICSYRINKEVHGSQNGNATDGIGHFKFTFPKWEDKIDYYVFAFLDSVNHNIELVIVPNEILRSRFKKLNRFPASPVKAELTLWLMPDRFIYDTTNISTEGEWYYMSKGVNGRMADGTDWDYTEYLNNWVGWMVYFESRGSNF